MKQLVESFGGLWFFLYLIGIINVAQLFLEIYFICRFTARRPMVLYYLCYIPLSFCVDILEIFLQSAPVPSLFFAFRITLLWGLFRVLDRTGPGTLPAAVITKTVSLLAGGISSSITFLFLPLLGNISMSPLEMLLTNLCFPLPTLLLIVVFHRLILKRLLWSSGLPNKYFMVFFLPFLLALMVEQYIFNDVYGNEVIMDGAVILKPLANHWQILLIQLFVCFALFSTLYACRKLTDDFAQQTRLALLNRELDMQKTYLEETCSRYEQTRAFRHDVKNHLLLLNGLLEHGEVQRAMNYLGKLEQLADSLSVFCKTGNTAVDFLLNSKLSIASQSGIQLECTVRIPASPALDDLDLCVLFSNAVDNAIHACNLQEGGARYIRLSGRQTGDIFLLEIENSSPPGEYQKSTGLSNIEAIAEKYRGAVTTEKNENCFLLTVLLFISGCLDNI